MAATLIPPDLNSSSSTDSSSTSNRSISRSLRVAEKAKKGSKAEDPIVAALKYFSKVQKGTPCRGNDEFENNLVTVERVAYSKGLSPEAISVMLEFAMSLRMGTVPCVRVLKCLLPSTVVPHQAVVRAVVWLCVGKLSISTQVLFIKWVLTVFDMIDAKDNLRAIYGFLFSFVTEENLCPYVCHLLYLLTRKECVRLFRVRKLLELHSKLGKQPYLLHLLSLYKVFCPELVTLSLNSRIRAGFGNHNGPWKLALIAIQKRTAVLVSSDLPLALQTQEKAGSRKRKLGHLDLPVLTAVVQSQKQTSLSQMVVPLAQIQSFVQLLENLHLIELPAQMGSLLGSSLALHYLDCVQDESAFLRLNFWLGHSLHEEFLFCGHGGASQGSDEAVQFLERLMSTQDFLQEGFSSVEAFLYKFLNVWDGSLLRPQILALLSNVPVVPSTCISRLLSEPLEQLFFTSKVFFKCGLIESLNGMLVKWLTWHSVYALEDGRNVDLDTSMNVSRSGFMLSVGELVRFVGRLATLGLQLEGCHSLLLSFILDFYDTVCDIFQKYGLPLVVMIPRSVFYPALFAFDPISVDRLAKIMNRYKINLTAAKKQEKMTGKAFHISLKTYQEFNHYLAFMVNCLWNSRIFQPGDDIELSEELLHESGVPRYWASFSLTNHPAFHCYAIDFHHKCWPERRDVDLKSIQHLQQWGWYLEYLFTQGFDGLRQFIQSNIKTSSRGP
ncbi:centromere protein I [Gadus macrocephalus]|uniref:centromere protein I n=1 Tax=Gadus macrocephalus TaxID=80720 RepID=UPI0028CB7DF3|nr:centromere protein I [Gadus macrocephalus]